MVTKWWKKVVGIVTANRQQANNSVGSTFVTQPVNLIDVTGALIPNLVVGAYRGASESQASASASATKNNASPFGYIGDKYDPTTVEVYSSYTRTGGYSRMVYGVGTTPPSNTDYNLEAPILEGIGIESTNVQVRFNEDSGNYEQTLTVVGSVSEDMVINEVGIVKSVWTSGNEGNYGTAANYSNILVCREVLAEPLNLKAGDSFTVSIMIEQ